MDVVWDNRAGIFHEKMVLSTQILMEKNRILPSKVDGYLLEIHMKKQISNYSNPAKYYAKSDFGYTLQPDNDYGFLTQMM